MKKEFVEHLEYARNLIKTNKGWRTDKKYSVTTALAESLVHHKCGLNFMGPCINTLHMVSEKMGYKNVHELNKAGSSTVITLYDLAIQFVQDGVVRL